MVRIEWIKGAQHARDEDTKRALQAARDVLAARGVSPAEASQSQPDAWREAEQAADLAATAGWHNPDGGAVELVYVE